VIIINYKKYTLIIVSIILLLSTLSAIYAADDTNNTVEHQQIDDTTYHKYTKANVDKIVIVENKTIHNYEEFKNKSKNININNNINATVIETYQNQTFNLEGEKEYIEKNSSTVFFFSVGDFNWEQEIDLTINGNNHIINLNKSDYGMYTNNGSIQLNNIHFTNGEIRIINSDKCIMEFNNCTFTKCNMSIFNEGNFTLNNCIFEDNYNYYNDPLIYNSYYLANMTIKNSIFKNNHLRLISTGGYSLNIDSCNFTNNVANIQEGQFRDFFGLGLILVEKNMNMNNCNFILSNDINYSVITNKGLLNINNTKFENGVNTYLLNNSGFYNITHSYFKNNRNKVSLIYDNYIKPIEVFDPKTGREIPLKNVYNQIQYNTFEYNKGSIGTILLLNHSKVRLYHNNIEHNTASKYAMVYNRGKLVTYNNTFKQNTAKIAGAIYNEKILRITRDNYLKNTATVIAGTIYNKNDTIMQTTTINNATSINAAAVYNEENATFIINRSYFHHNKATENATIYNDGIMRIYSTRINNNSADNAAAIYTSRYLILYNDAIKNNTANTASAIYNKYNKYEPGLYINNTLITNNYAKIMATIINDARMYINNSSIKNNDKNKIIIVNQGQLIPNENVTIQNTKYPDENTILHRKKFVHK